MDEKEFLEKYDDSVYEKPSVTADINIFSVFDEQESNYRKLSTKKLKILLIRRGQHPFKGMYALPGGFVRKEETVDEAAYRELKEETGVECTFLEQIKTFSQPGRDPRRWVITCAYMALIDGKNDSVQGGDDAEDALWFDVSFAQTADGDWALTLQHGEERIEAVLRCGAGSPSSEFSDWKLLRSSNIAFDHALIIAAAVVKLRRLTESADSSIIFRLLPEYFPLSEAQQICEVILDRKLYAQVFRRQIKEYVEETQEYTEAAGHRPSKLYRHKYSGHC